MQLDAYLYVNTNLDFTLVDSLMQEHDPSSTAARQLRQIDRHKRNNQRIMDALMQLANQDLLVALIKRKAWNK